MIFRRVLNDQPPQLALSDGVTRARSVESMCHFTEPIRFVSLFFLSTGGRHWGGVDLRVTIRRREFHSEAYR